MTNEAFLKESEIKPTFRTFDSRFLNFPY